MEAAVSLSLQHHHHGLPVPPPHHHRSSLPVAVPQTSIRRPCVVRSSSSNSKPPAACLTQSQTDSVHPTAAGDRNYSSRAATGYAAALPDACARAGTLRRASANARAILSRRQVVEEEVDARVAALLRMLVTKGKAAMVPEVMADFAAICHNLLLPRASRSHSHAY
ncbi:hypothetical protein QOZ80_6AG0550790 [Eleusine coracana subsp. coracana]|nr:hypothetical protein QOZ80_6AG0550790 [Eleusine coracana subsp. coracana]